MLFGFVFVYIQGNERAKLNYGWLEIYSLDDRMNNSTYSNNNHSKNHHQQLNCDGVTYIHRETWVPTANSSQIPMPPISKKPRRRTDWGVRGQPGAQGRISIGMGLFSDSENRTLTCQPFDESLEVRSKLRYHKTLPQLSSSLWPPGPQARENLGQNTKYSVLKS